MFIKSLVLIASIASIATIATTARAVDAATPAQLEEGKGIYMTICIACHQPTGLGLPGVFPSLAKSDFVAGSPERLTAMVLKGINPPFKYKDVTYAVPMIPQEAVLTDDKIASVLTYVRASFENSAASVSGAFVSGVRKKFLDRKTPWTEAELTAWKDEAAPVK